MSTFCLKSIHAVALATRDSSQVARDKEIASMDSGTKDSTNWNKQR